ncbi:hypothetical protein FRB90_002876 [Tulasnella sp. 427]|nr:hypothetical protein FRB90_002876 [Tulasnella sp. 427]
MSLQAIIDAMTTAMWHIEISRYVTVAGCTILVYDHLITLPDEIELIWGKPLSPVSCLFLFNRYTVPIVALIDFWQFGGLARGVSNKASSLTDAP